MHNARTEDPSATIQHWLRERKKKGQPPFQPKRHVKGKNKKPLKASSKAIIEFARARDKMRILRDHEMRPEKRYWHEVVGFNYRMTNLQAALGVAQLEKIDAFIRRKREIAETYNSILKDVKGVTLPPGMPWAKNVYWPYSILVNEKEFGISRDKLMIKLAENGVETRFFYPIHTMPPYKKYAGNCTFHVADGLSSCGINLPSGVKLTKEKTEEITQFICALNPKVPGEVTGF